MKTPTEIRRKLKAGRRAIEKGRAAQKERGGLLVAGFESGMATSEIAEAAGMKETAVRVARHRYNHGE